MKTKLYIVPKIRVISNASGKPLMTSGGGSKAPKRPSFSLSNDDTYGAGLFNDSQDTGWSHHGAF